MTTGGSRSPATSPTRRLRSCAPRRARAGRAAAGRDRRALSVAAVDARQAEPARARGRRPRTALAIERRVRVRGARRGRRGERAPKCSDGELGSSARTSWSTATSSDVIERLAELSADDVVLEIGGGEGCCPSDWRPGRASARGRGRPERSSRPSATFVGFSNVTVHFPTRSSSTSGAGPGADRGRREPAVRDRRDRDPAHDRRAAVGRGVGGDGSARGRRAARGGAGVAGVRGAVGAGSARVRGQGAAAGVAHGVPAGAAGRLGARRAAAAGRVRVGGSTAVRTLVHDAFAHRRKALAGSLALAPGGRRACASARARRSWTWAIRPMSAPSGSRRRSSSSLRRGWRSGEAVRAGAGEGQPEPVRRLDGDPTGATS